MPQGLERVDGRAYRPEVRSRDRGKTGIGDRRRNRGSSCKQRISTASIVWAPGCHRPHPPSQLCSPGDSDQELRSSWPGKHRPLTLKDSQQRVPEAPSILHCIHTLDPWFITYLAPKARTTGKTLGIGIHHASCTSRDTLHQHPAAWPRITQKAVGLVSIREKPEHCIAPNQHTA